MSVVSRYSRAAHLDLGAQIGTSFAIQAIRAAMKNGTLATRQVIVRGAERLDTMAGSIYGDARYWWILAATSNIGWGLQVPPGTIINVADLGDITRIVG